MTVVGKSGQAWGRGFDSSDEAPDPQAAARKLLELAASIEAVQDGRIHIEKMNYFFLYTLNESGTELGAGIRCAVEKGWLELHESGTYVRLLAPGHDLLALR
jgi:hypothetical protein